MLGRPFDWSCRWDARPRRTPELNRRWPRQRGHGYRIRSRDTITDGSSKPSTPARPYQPLNPCPSSQSTASSLATSRSSTLASFVRSLGDPASKRPVPRGRSHVARPPYEFSRGSFPGSGSPLLDHLPPSFCAAFGVACPRPLSPRSHARGGCAHIVRRTRRRSSDSRWRVRRYAGHGVGFNTKYGSGRLQPIQPKTPTSRRARWRRAEQAEDKGLVTQLVRRQHPRRRCAIIPEALS